MKDVISCYQFSTSYSDIYNCLNYVYFTQVDAVKQLIDNAQHIPEISHLVLFGSSITLGCGSDSDVDVLVLADDYDESYSLLKKLHSNVKKPLDLIPETICHFKEAACNGNTIYNEILEKGLLIYERST